jgi:hypothetical protein
MAHYGPDGPHQPYQQYPPYPPAVGSAASAPLYLPNLIVAMVAAVGVVVGSIGPWVTFLALSVGGVGRDGTITLILGIVAGGALFAVLNLGRSRGSVGWMVGLSAVAAVAGLVTVVTAVVDIYGVMSQKTELFGRTIGADVGWGLWLVLITALVLVATSIIVAVQVPKLRKA